MTAKFITVVGAKDGCGVTSFSMNLAFLLHKLSSKKVLLVDYDCDFCGDQASFLKLKQSVSFSDIHPLIGKKNIHQILDGLIPRHPQGVFCLSLLSPEKKEFSLKPSLVRETLGLLKESFDYVILDAGSHWTPLHTEVLLGASLIYLTISPEPQVLHAAEKKLNSLWKIYVPKEKLKVIVNNWEESGNYHQKRIEDCYTGLLTSFLPLVSHMKEAKGNGLPFCLSDVRHRYSLALEELIERQILNCKLPSFELVSCSDELQSTISPLGNFVPSSEDLSSHSLPSKKTSEGNQWDTLKRQILKSLLKVFNFKSIGIGKVLSQKDKLALRDEASESILKIINEMGQDQISLKERQQLVKEVLDEALGLGPLEAYLNDSTISEVMINGKDNIYIEKAGKLELTSARFSSEDQLYAIIERIVAPIGRRVDESSPLVDARLSDGSRVNVIIPPLSLVGPVVTIRRFSAKVLEAKDLVKFGTLSESMADFLRAAIEARLNIIVSGGTGTGKTTFLNVLSSFIPNEQRIVTIEDAAELRLNQHHVISLESRPPNIEGKGDISIRTLLKNTLRMRPDRIIIGECRGGEALDMLQAMNTGHDGSLTTIHANSPRDCISRLETLVMFSGIQLPSKAIRFQISSAVDLVVQLSRLSDGSRKITKISEVTGMEGEIVTLQDIFVFKQEGVNKEKQVLGKHTATGIVPRFVETLQARGIELSRKYFEVGLAS